MEQLIVNIKDTSKLQTFLDLMKNLDFVEVLKGKKVEKVADTAKDDNYDFFQSAGLWGDRQIDADQLRKDAWNRKG